MVETIKDSERYYKSFIQELEDYNDLDKLEFYEKYIDSKYENEISNEWDLLDSETKEEYEDYDDFKKNYIEDNFDDDKIEDSIREYFDPLDVETYTSDNNPENKIYYIQLTWWWPNIDLTVDTKWWTGLYEFHWWSDVLKRYIDKDLVETYMNILWLEC